MRKKKGLAALLGGQAFAGILPSLKIHGWRGLVTGAISLKSGCLKWLSAE